MSELSPIPGPSGIAEPVPLDIKIVDQFGDQRWRLWNLYWVINEQGQEVRFVPNEMQEKFWNDLWYRNVILKSRQHGCTTFVDMFLLDSCVFYPNQTAGIIALTLDDVKKIFRRKIRYPYDKLPEQIKSKIYPINDTQNELVFSNKSEINVDTGFRGGTYNLLHVCLSGRTKIILANGATKRIEEIVPNDRVLTSTGGHGRVKRLVRNRLSDLGEQMVALRTFGNPDELRLTGSHRVLCRDHGVWRKSRGRPTWKRAGEIRLGDYIAYPTREPSARATLRIGEETVTPSFDFGRLCGLYISEGHRRRTEVTFGLDKAEVPAVLELLDKFQPLYRSRRVYQVRTSRTAMVTINSQHFGQWLSETFGHLAWNKTIPDAVWKWGAPFLRGLLKGYFDGDGHYGDMHLVTATTVSSALAMQLKLLLLSLRYGYPAVYHSEAGYRYGRNCREAWTLHLTGSGNWKYRKEHGLPLPALGTGAARWRVANGLNPGGRKRWRRGATYYWARVTSVAEADPEEFVYDIVLDESPHDYVTSVGVVHNSELGKISTEFPERAIEVKVGSFNTVHPGNYIFAESTGHGKGGVFYELTMQARAIARSGRPLTQLDFKYHFYPWWFYKGNALPTEDAKRVVFTRRDTEYFARVEKIMSTILSLEQRAWYVITKQWNGPEMLREQPSTHDEPFEAVLKGALFAELMHKAREERRITKVRHDPGLAVDTWWDIGRRDKTAIWFVQMIGNECRFIWYYENTFAGLPHYVEYCNKLRTDNKWNYRHHLAPHDMTVTEWGSNRTRWETARNLGYTFAVGQQYDQKDQIDAARALLPMCLFDEENCADGITHLEQVRREWNEHLQSYMDKFMHNDHSHGASAFMNGAMMLGKLTTPQARARPVESRRFAT